MTSRPRTRSKPGAPASEEIKPEDIPKELRPFNKPGKAEQDAHKVKSEENVSLGSDNPADETVFLSADEEDLDEPDELNSTIMAAGDEDPPVGGAFGGGAAGGGGANPRNPQQPPATPPNAGVITRQDWQAQRQHLLDLEARLAALTNQQQQPIMPMPQPQAVVQDTKIPPYEGADDTRPADAWYERASNVALANNWTDKRFIEAAVNAMTKDAESWVKQQRYLNDMKRSDSLTNRATFKTAFFKQFDKSKSPSSQTRTITNLKQGRKENVNSFYVRVCNTFSETVTDQKAAKNWQPNEPTQQVPPNNDFVAMQAVADYVQERLISVFFVDGLVPSIGDIIRPRMKELQAEGEDALLNAAKEAELALPQRKSSDPAEIAAVVEAASRQGMDEGATEAMVAAFKTYQQNRKGGGQQRSGKQTRGRGGARGLADGPRLQAIKDRRRPRFCNRCKQWGKHERDECRHTSQQIAAMTPMNPSDPPSRAALHDKCFDGKSEMPPQPAENE
jgi:hypothetical protein